MCQAQAGIAQSVEHFTRNEGVVSSSLISSFFQERKSPAGLPGQLFFQIMREQFFYIIGKWQILYEKQRLSMLRGFARVIQRGIVMDETEQKIVRRIEDHKKEIIGYAEDIEAHPEPGFQEIRTADKTVAFLERLGMRVERNIALTGIRASWGIRPDCPNIAVIGEMDAIGCASHPKSDPVTKAAHACGHHAQMAAMVGTALAFADPEIRRELDGSLTFLGVPAEEYIDADKRKALRRKGILFGSGKSEMIRTGVFDHTELAMTSHVHMVPVLEDFYLGNPACNGFDAERVTVRGRAAHAAIDPWNGVNALSIATSALQMMGLMRETFREEDHVRLHNVIRKAGDVVNSVPDEAVLETKIRAASLEKIRQIREMADRAYDGAAYAFGGRIERENLPGYMPIRPRMADQAMVQAAEALGLSYRKIEPGDFNNACTDVGDLTHLLPVVNFTFGGFEGRLHGSDFRIVDKEKAYVLPAKLQALTIYRLLKNRAEKAREIIDGFIPVFDKKGYTEYIYRQMETDSGCASAGSAESKETEI